MFNLIPKVSSITNRIQIPCLKPLGRVQFECNSDCECSMCVQTLQPKVPWMQSVPRFGVIDNHQRPIPDLNPSGASAKSPLPSHAISEPDEMLQTQIKLNTGLMQRVDALEAEIKVLAAASDQAKKGIAFYKAKYNELLAECNQLKEKLAKRKPYTNVDLSANKENMSQIDEPRQAFN